MMDEKTASTPERITHSAPAKVPRTTTVSATRSVKEALDMANRMASGTGGRIYPQGPSVVKPKGPPVSEDAVLGALYGLTPATAHQRKLVAHRFVADVIRLRREAGDSEGAATYARCIQMALRSWPDKQGNVEANADRTDAEEDVLQSAYRANPCEATARPFLRKRAQARECEQEHDVQIAQRWGIQL